MQLDGELTLEPGQRGAREVFEVVAAAIQAHGFAKDQFCGAGSRPPTRNRAHFQVRGSLFGCAFTPIDGFNLDLLFLETTASLFQLEVILDVLLRALNAKQGFLHSAEYYLWQNAEQPVQYEAAGKDHSTLPKVHNGLPPPLADQWIDVSRNPGRRYLRQGFQEAVSSPMWLRADQLSKQQLEELKCHPRFRLTASDSHWQIRHAQSPFAEDSGADQEYLRRVCFGTECA